MSYLNRGPGTVFPYDAGGGGLGTVSLSSMSPVLSILGLHLSLGATCLVIKYTDTDTDTDVLFWANMSVLPPGTGDGLRHVLFDAGSAVLPPGRRVSSILSLVSGGSGTAFSTYVRTAPGGGGGGSLRHVLDDAGMSGDCLQNVLFDVVRGEESLQHLLFSAGRAKDNFQHVRCDTGRARDRVHFQHVNSDAKRAGDSFQQHHGYRQCVDAVSFPMQWRKNQFLI